MKKYLPLLGSFVGIIAVIWLWNLTDYKIAIAMTLMLFANNLCFIDTDAQREISRKNSKVMREMEEILNRIQGRV